MACVITTEIIMKVILLKSRVDCNGATQQSNGREARTATFEQSHKRSILKLQKKADFYRIPKAKIGRSFETLIMG